MANDNIDTKLYPPLPSDEMKDAHGYNHIERVVVTQTGVWGRAADGGWVRFTPLRDITNTSTPHPKD